MGALLTRLYGVDQTTPYGFKFSGITLWLLAADAGVQRVIDDFNPNCPRWLAHSTLQYGMRLDEADARRRFARLKNAVEGSGPITLRLSGPPDLYGPYGDVPPYQMRGIGVMFRGSLAYDQLPRVHGHGSDVFSCQLEVAHHTVSCLLHRLVRLVA